MIGNNNLANAALQTEGDTLLLAVKEAESAAVGREGPATSFTLRMGVTIPMSTSTRALALVLLLSAVC